MVLYENDSPRRVSEKFGKKHNLPVTKQEKLAKMLGLKLQENKKKEEERVKELKQKDEPTEMFLQETTQ